MLHICLYHKRLKNYFEKAKFFHIHTNDYTSKVAVHYLGFNNNEDNYNKQSKNYRMVNCKTQESCKD